MVAIEEKVRELFEQGNKSKEVFEILSDEGIKTTLNTIKHYYTSWNKGFGSWYEYQKYLRDLDFKEIWDSDGLDKISKDNPYFLMISEEEEILPEKGRERIEYIGKLRKGLKILRQLGKI